MERITLRLKAVPDPEAQYQRLLADLRAGVGAEVDCDDLLFTRIRVGIAEGDLTASEVQVLFGGEEIQVDRSGALHSRPKTLASAQQFDLLNRMLRAHATQRKAQD